MKKTVIAALLGSVAFANETVITPSTDLLLEQSNGQTCDDWGVIDLPNNLYMLNNKWGKDKATGDSYECISATRVDYKWVTAWGGNNVKCYPAIIAGWHWGYLKGMYATGLPVRVDSKPKIMTTWRVHHQKSQDFEQLNTSWDIWLGQPDELNPTTPSVEIMIWINHVAQYPIGSQVDTVNIWGANWNVYRGNIG